MLGTTAILVTFLFFVGSGLRVALSARSPFETLLATGLTSLLGFQAFIIIGGILRVLPLTGVTLPFVSYGGSSLISNYVILAILFRISHNSVVERAEELERIEASESTRSSTPRSRPSGRPSRREGPSAMNRPIKHVVVVLLICFTALFVQLNRIQVLRRPGAGRQPGQHPDHPARLQPAPGSDHHPGRRGGRRVSEPLPPGGFFAFQRLYPHGELYAHVVGLHLVHLRGRGGRAGVQRRPDRTDRSPGAVGPDRPPGGRQPGRQRPPDRPGRPPAAGPPAGLEGRAGVGGGPRPGHRRDPGHVLQPVVRPQPSSPTTTAARPTRPGPSWSTTEGNPLLAKAYREIFFPGSTFKVVTAASALDATAA